MEGTKLDDILEIVTFIKDNAATKQDLSAVEQRLDSRIDKLDNKVDKLDDKVNKLSDKVNQLETQIHEVKNEMIDHVDGFIGLHRKQEVELAAMAMRQNRTDANVNKIAKHLNLEIA